jgi:hypothetical protein
MLFDLPQAFQQFYLTSIGIAVLLGILNFVARRQSARWRRLAAHYAAPQTVDITARKRLQAIILLGGGGRLTYTGYAGVTTISLTGDCLRLRLLFPWSIHHPPLSIPFADLQVTQTDWYLNTQSFELTAAKAPEVKIIMTGALLDWIAASAPQWSVDTRRRW